ncbi:16S rRNA (cytidine(1402)-2'-O)-methyltransferase [bacterium]|nr:16S rRNA (cytidine(1402)-2'-O)-methyltransferase [bacterium]
MPADFRVWPQFAKREPDASLKPYPLIVMTDRCVAGGIMKKNSPPDTASPARGPVVFVVATPIGNLSDLSERAIRTLASADVIAAEDTRQTRKLLTHLQQTQGTRGIAMGSPDLVACHDHNEEQQATRLIGRIVERGEVLALVSDAGTPCISDPGFRLVAAARDAGITVHPVPGPSALLALASAAGLPTDRLLFTGFPPTKPKALHEEVQGWIAASASVVFFESTRRLGKTLAAVAKDLPGARVAVGRELTKLHEEIFRGTIEDAAAWAAAHENMRGEASVMIDVRSATVESAGQSIDTAREVTRMLRKGASLKDILQELGPRSAAAGMGRKDLYRLVLEKMGKA